MNSYEYKQKMSLANSGEKNGMYGKHHSEKAKRKISKAHKGKKLTKETKQKIHNYFLGKKRCKICKTFLDKNKINEHILKEHKSSSVKFIEKKL